MKFIRGILNATPEPQGLALTIGNFDGIHVGHAKIAARVKEVAKERGLLSAAMFFEPQPREFFRPDSCPPRLTSLHEKYLFMRNLGIDRLYCLRFSEKIANLPPEVFIKDILIGRLNAKHIVIGDDFRFGAKRQGCLETLRAETNFTCEATPSYLLGERRISSTAIREALQLGNLTLAEGMLGRPYSITGKVVHGKQLGRTIGFPTANVALNRIVVPVSGVYAVSAMIDGIEMPGIANIGMRPTVNGTNPTLETHIFDFARDIYGLRITVKFLKKLRDECKFDSVMQLRDAIALDMKTAQEFFAHQKQTEN